MTFAAASEWDDQSPAPRSTLHRLAPIGIGTPQVEALTSYVMRLAASHALPVGSLAVDVVGPELGRTRVYGDQRTDRASFFKSAIYRDAHTLNGHGEYAARWAEAIGRLVLRDELGELTMLSWRDMVPERGMLRRHLAVCPLCLRDQENERGAIYEPLIWSVAAVNACAIHDCLLLGTCPHCGIQPPPLSWHAKAGHCRRCSGWLGVDDPRERTPGDRDRWVSGSIARLIALSAKDRRRVGTTAAVMEEAISRAGGTAAALARATGRSPGLISEWRHGSVAPTLQSLLLISAAARLDFVALVRGEAVDDPSPRPPQVTTAIEPRTVIDWTRVREQMEAALTADPPITVSALHRTLEVDRQTMRERFPDLADKLVVRRRAWAARQTAERRMKLVDAVHQAVRAIRDGGDHPSRRRVEARLPAGVSLREPVLRAAWREAVGGAASA
jgi:transcriptional regulator with XRE-family HTH domain